jgi:hypothetical protein
MNMHPCRTCRHWDQRYPENKGLGDCGRVNVLMAEDEYIALSATPIEPPVRELVPSGRALPALRTQADFGCIAWEPRR